MLNKQQQYFEVIIVVVLANLAVPFPCTSSGNHLHDIEGSKITIHEELLKVILRFS